MGLYQRGGRVFTACTTDWAQLLANGSDPHAETITRNVVNELSR